MFKVLITGGRDLPEAEIVWVPLWQLLHQKEAIVVVHGACPNGADQYAHEWFQLPGQAFNRKPSPYEKPVEYMAIEEAHAADWTRFGKSAGPRRNQEMVNTDPDAVFAFPTPKSRGTLDCMARAWVRGIKVYVWHYLDIGRYHVLTDSEGEALARKKLGWGDPAKEQFAQRLGRQ